MMPKDIPCPVSPELMVMSRYSIIELDGNLVTFFLQNLLEIFVPSDNSLKPFFLAIIEIEPIG